MQSIRVIKTYYQLLSILDLCIGKEEKKHVSICIEKA